MPHDHGRILGPTPGPAPRAWRAPFSLLRLGLGPRLTVAAGLAALVWGLIGWAIGWTAP